MAVNRMPRVRVRVSIACTALVVAVSTPAGAGEAGDGLARSLNPVTVARSAVAWLGATGTALREGAGRLQPDTRRPRGASTPDWVQLRSGLDTGPPAAPSDGDPYLTLQERRPDGTDLLTIRYPLAGRGALRTYAGAGLNRAQYFDDGDEFTPTMLSRRNRRSSLGAAAEVGAELRVSERVQLAADLRWADLDASADVLRAAHGPVAAEPLLLGMTLGYRFR
jgi:hypothetical protein